MHFLKNHLLLPFRKTCLKQEQSNETIRKQFTLLYSGLQLIVVAIMYLFFYLILIFHLLGIHKKILYQYQLKIMYDFHHKKLISSNFLLNLRPYLENQQKIKSFQFLVTHQYYVPKHIPNAYFLLPCNIHNLLQYK